MVGVVHYRSLSGVELDSSGSTMSLSVVVACSLLCLTTACGFEIPSEPESQGTTVQAAPVLLPDGPANPVGLAGPVGVYGVTRDGTATYTFPVQAPPGRGGIEPQLALRYDSNAGFGLSGQGWSLDGLSAIRRCPKLPSPHGTRRAVAFDADDGFCLDGKYILPVSNPPSLPPGAWREFRTENDQGARIRAFGNGQPEGATGWDIAYFTVEYPSGIVHILGQTSGNARGIFGKTASWLLTKVEDRHGLYMTVDYGRFTSSAYPAIDSEDTEVLPIRIDYTGSSAASLVPAHQLRLNYEDRAFIRAGFDLGARRNATKRLSSITFVSVDGRTHPSYSFTYVASIATGRDLLQSISFCGGSPSICAPATRFEYSGSALAFASAETVANATFGRITNQPFWPTMADIDGDGRDDFVYNMVPVSGVSGRDADLYVMFASRNSTGPRFDPPIRMMSWSLSGQTSGSVQDINGDGRQDVVAYSSTPGDAPIALMSEGRTLRQLTFNVVREYPLELVDLNGDGLADLLECDNSGDQFYRVRMATGPAVFGPRVLTAARCPAVVRADMDGDGAVDLERTWNNFLHPSGNPRVDMMRLSAPNGTPLTSLERSVPIQGSLSNWTSTAPTYIAPSYPQVGDANGDGIPDVFMRRPTTGDFSTRRYTLYRTMVEPLRGRSMILDARPWPPEYVADLDDIGGDGTVEDNSRGLVADFDGDGCDDDTFISPFTSGVETVFLWRRNCLTRAPGLFTIPLPARSVPANNMGRRLHYTADVDGDGRQDILVFLETGDLVLLRALGGRPDLLTSIRRLSDTPEATFTYGSLSDPGVYSSVACLDDASSSCVRGGRAAVVRSLTEELGGVTARVQTFFYSNGRVDRRGRGWLGMGGREIRDPVRNTTRLESYDNVTTVAGAYPFIEGVRSSTQATILSAATSDSRVMSSMYRRSRTVALLGGGAYRVNLDWEETRETVGDGMPWVASTRTRLVGRSMRTIRSRDTRGHITREDVLSADGSLTELIRSVQHISSPWIHGLETGRQLISRSGTTSGQQVFSRTFDSLGRVETETVRAAGDPLRLTTRFSYDLFGRLRERVTGVGRPDARIESWSYQYVDPAQQTVMQVSHANALGHISRTLIHPLFGSAWTSIDPNGEQVSLRYDALGRIVESIDPAGVSRRTQYATTAYATSPATYALVLTDPARPDVVVLYDFRGRAFYSETTNYSGVRVARVIGFDTLGRPELASDPLEAPAYLAQSVPATRTQFDELGRVVEVRRSDGSSQAWEHGWRPDGDMDTAVIRHSDALGRISELRLDRLRRLRQVVDARGGIERHEYDASGYPLRVTDATGRLSSTTYDPYGLKLASFEPSSGPSAYAYTAFGNIQSVWNPEDGNTSFTQDALGRAVSVRSSLGRTITFEYDRPTGTCTNPSDMNCPIQNHSVGRLTAATSGDGHRTEWSYDYAGRRSTESLRIGARTMAFEYEYDELGRQSALRYPTMADGTSVTVRYEYMNGFVSAATSSDGKYAYWQRRATDLWGNTTEEQFGNGVRSLVGTDALGRITSLRDVGPSSGTLRSMRYDYDQEGNMLGRRDLLQNASEYFRYDRLDRIEQACLAPGIAVSAPRPIEPRNWSPGPSSGAWPTAGGLPRIGTPGQAPGVALPGPGPAASWSSPAGLTTQDPAESRILLTTAVVVTTDGSLPGSTAPPPGCRTYSYDAVGNFTSKSDVGTFTYPGQTSGGRSLAHAPRQIGSRLVTYDRVGRLTGLGSDRLAYDELGSLREVRLAATQAATTFEYDAFGSRAVKRGPNETVLLAGRLFEEHQVNAPGSRSVFGVAATYGLYQLIVEGRAIGELRHQLVPMTFGSTDFNRLPWRAAPGLTGTLDPAALSRLSLRASTLAGTRTLTYFHRDPLGSVERITDSQGAVLERRSYDPFGQSRSPDWLSGNVVPSYADRPVGFTGQRDDVDLGLINMQGRIYHPGIGRFTTPDPLVQAPGFSQSQSRYSYVWNRPLRMVDPSGLEANDAAGRREIVLDQVHIIGNREPDASALDRSSSPGYIPAGEVAESRLMSLAFSSVRDAAWGAYTTYRAAIHDLSGLGQEVARDAGDSVSDAGMGWATGALLASAIEGGLGIATGVLGIGLIPEQLANLPSQALEANQSIREGLATGNNYKTLVGVGQAMGVVGAVAGTIVGAKAGVSNLAKKAQSATGAAGELRTVNPNVLKPTQAIGEMSKGRAIKIAKSIRKNGYDAAEPILVGEGGGALLIIDGHHRAAAAAAAGREVVVKSVGPVAAESAGWSIETFARGIRGILKW